MPTFKPRNTMRARELRNAAVPAERELWKYLNRRQRLGMKFSRQLPVGPYFADFLCRDLKLIIEVDGYSHDLSLEHDHIRDHYLRGEGYRILRFANRDIFENMPGVIADIDREIGTIPTPNPSRKREGSLA